MMKRTIALLCAVIWLSAAAMLSFAEGEGPTDPAETSGTGETSAQEGTGDPASTTVPEETTIPAETTAAPETTAPQTTAPPSTTKPAETTVPPETEETTSPGTYIPNTVVTGVPEPIDAVTITPVTTASDPTAQPDTTRSPEDTVPVIDGTETAPDGDGILLWQDETNADPAETQTAPDAPRSHSASAVLTVVGIGAACALCITGVLLLYRYIFPNLHHPKS